MSMSPQLEKVIESIDKLSTSEQMAVIDWITSRLKKNEGSQAPLRWLDLAGTVPYPLLGEDAQDWVSRSREIDQQYRNQLHEH